MFSFGGLFFMVMFQITVRLNLLYSADWDQPCVAAKRSCLKAENEWNQSNRLRRITTEGHVRICVWGGIECARTCICVTHPWVVIEPPQGHGSRQSFTCSNNNWGNLTTQAKIYNQPLKAFIERNPYSADKQCLCYNSLAADMYTYQSLQDSEYVSHSACICIFLL